MPGMRTRRRPKHPSRPLSRPFEEPTDVIYETEYEPFPPAPSTK